MNQLLKSLQASGVNVIESKTDNAMSISIGNHVLDDSTMVNDSKMYKIVDGSGGVMVYRTGGFKTEQLPSNEQRVITATDSCPNDKEVRKRCLIYHIKF